MGAGFGIETMPVMWDAYHLDYRIEKKPGYPFLESPGNFSGPENWFVFIQYQSFNNFKNNKMKLSVIEEKLAGSWARNCATTQQVWILKFACGIEKFKFRGFRETGPLVGMTRLISRIAQPLLLEILLVHQLIMDSPYRAF